MIWNKVNVQKIANYSNIHFHCRANFRIMLGIFTQLLLKIEENNGRYTFITSWRKEASFL